ncbi:aldehyde dehydrogenase family protein, partial [Blastomonas sp. UPD001]|uniref:aldehyde dehydrogenase family protein n=1 Tax=Blastomonas sp. UPD001 TaxID=2217673 RepID=UPI001E647523
MPRGETNISQSTNKATSLFKEIAMLEYGALIDGAVTTGGPYMEVINPATGDAFARARNCTDSDLNTAVAAARRAYPAWRDLARTERAACLAKAAEVIRAHMSELGELQTLEQGKILNDSLIEAGAAAHWFATAANIPFPESTNEDSEGRLNRTVYGPLGVVAAIVPWNVPLLQVGFKVPLALYAGNTVILKPSPFTPIATLRLAALLAEVFPAGVFNVLSGDDSLGPKVTAHPGIDKISFTGSTATGRKIMENASAELVRVTLELGGNDAAIVLDDVDVEAAAKSLFAASCRNTGQLCVAAKRIFVQESIYPAFGAAFKSVADAQKIGNGLDAETTMGPIQNKRQFDRLSAIAATIKKEGYTLIKDGGPREGPGLFFDPMIVDNPPESSQIVSDEQFGPIVPLLSFKTVDEVVERANASPYGLAASVWTKDLNQAAQIADRLEAGTVWINEIFHFSPMVPFGGHKDSGIGAESGVDGLKAFLQPKTISMNRGP